MASAGRQNRLNNTQQHIEQVLSDILFLDLWVIAEKSNPQQLCFGGLAYTLYSDGGLLCHLPGFVSQLTRGVYYEDLEHWPQHG